MPKQNKAAKTKDERNRRSLRGFKLHHPENEHASVAQLYTRARKMPHPEEFVGMSNAQLAAEFGVPPKYGKLIRTALDDAQNTEPTGERDIWAEWQATNGGG